MERQNPKWAMMLISLLSANLLWQTDALADLHFRQQPAGATLTVTSRTDSGPGSLRQALIAAHTGDTITFDPAVFLPGTPMTITLLAELPEIIQGELTIDGSNAGVVLDGRYTPGVTDGLRIRSDNNTIKGLQIVRFPGDGIELTGSASGNRIGGNWQAGSAPRGEGNIITLNGDEGIDVNGPGTDDNVIVGNLVGLDADGAQDVRIQALAISPAFSQDHTLFIGNQYHGVLKSADGGQHWQPTNTGLTSTNVLSLAISPAYPSDRTLFAGTTSGQIFRSTDGGASWAALNTGSAWRNISALAISPAYAADGQLFASTQGQGILGSGDRGATWEFLNEGVNDWVVHDLAVSPNFAADRSLYAVTGTAAFKSSDGGRTWRATSLPAMQQMHKIVLSPNYATDQTLFTSTHGCRTSDMLWKSTDGGDQWTAVGGSPSWCYIQALTIAPNYGSEPSLIVGDEWGGIYRSLDGGATWLNVHAARYATVAAFSPIYAQDRTAFLGSRNGTLLKSSDGTNSWHLTSETLTEEGNYNVGIHIREGAQRNIIGGSTVGLRNVVSKNGIDGIVISGSGSDSNHILGNTIGADLTGNRPLGNGGSGVVIREGAQKNMVGGASPGARNVVSGNRMSGITISSQDTTHNVVTGNYIGLGSDGSTALGNRYSGLKVDTGASQSRIGGTAPAETNVISGNGENGVTIAETSSNNIITGNRIGTNADGASAVPNYYQGVVLGSGAHHNRVGGTTVAERNLISGNGSNGIGVWETGTRFNVIIGNYLGTDASGNAALGNHESGVLLTNGAENNQVGGETPAEQNVIAGNDGAGVALSSSATINNTVAGNAIGVGADGVSQVGNRWGVACWTDAQFNTIRANIIANSAHNGIHLDSCDRNTITGNFIGTDSSGTRALGNGENGIMLFHAAAGNQLGPANVIAYNRGRGISIWDIGSVDNPSTENAIYGNSVAGIDLGLGGNNELTAPAIETASNAAMSGYAPVAGARVEIFSDESGQGRVYEGATVSAADGSFTFTKPAGFTGPSLTVTATDAAGNTSEFSRPVAKPPASGSDAYEPDVPCAQARPILTDGTIQPHTFHQAADVDWVRFDADAGATYVIQTANTQARADTVLTLYDACPNPPLQADDNAFGSGAQIIWQATQSGRFFISVEQHAPSIFGADTGYDLSVRLVTPPPIAVIVGGRDDGNRLWENIEHSADVAYRTFISAGVPKDNLRYFGQRPNRDVDGNGILDDIAGLPQPALVQDAIRNWARTRGVGRGVPFYLYLVDHGHYDQFLALGASGKITATDLDQWLGDLEIATGADTITVIIEACRSGSFIDVNAPGPATLSRPNRVIIASTASTLNAYPSPQGAYFSDVFWTAVGQSQDLRTAFASATAALERTRLSQTPWLDDNGDAVADARDGALARRRGLGLPFAGSPPVFDWAQIDPVIGGRASIRAQVRDDFNVRSVRAEIYAPNFEEPPPSSDGTTPQLNLPVVTLTPAGNDIYAADYGGFSRPGRYRVVFYADDGDGNQALPLAVSMTTNQGGLVLYLPLVGK